MGPSGETPNVSEPVAAAPDPSSVTATHSLHPCIAPRCAACGPLVCEVVCTPADQTQRVRTGTMASNGTVCLAFCQAQSVLPAPVACPDLYSHSGSMPRLREVIRRLATLTKPEMPFTWCLGTCPFDAASTPWNSLARQTMTSTQTTRRSTPAAQFVDEAAAEHAGRTPSTCSLSLQRCALVPSTVPPPSRRNTHALDLLSVALILRAASIRW